MYEVQYKKARERPKANQKDKQGRTHTIFVDWAKRTRTAKDKVQVQERSKRERLYRRRDTPARDRSQCKPMVGTCRYLAL